MPWVFLALGVALIVVALSRPQLAAARRVLRPAAVHGTIVLALVGCAALGPVLAGAAQGAQWLGTILDVAAAGADAYLDRHPHQATDAAVGDALRRARLALAALDGALAAGDAESVDVARDEAVEAYRALRELLHDLGILAGRPPVGGAETGAPVPQPFDLPTHLDVEARLR